MRALFATITNANFDRTYFVKQVCEALQLRDEVKAAVVKAGGSLPEKLPEAATWTAESVEDFEAKGAQVGILATENEDVRSLRELITYGLKANGCLYRARFGPRLQQ